MNCLSASAKLAIWLTRRNQAQSTGTVEPVLGLEGLLKAGLCSLGENKELFLFYFFVIYEKKDFLNHKKKTSPFHLVKEGRKTSSCVHLIGHGVP